jgi:phenylacetate-CoA ligase
MRTVQEEKLRALLEHARCSTARYANLLPPLTESSDPFELLRQIPPLSKQDVRLERARLYSTAGDSSAWRVASTTGTTGEPVEVVLDRQCREVETAVLADHLDKCVGPFEWRARDFMHLVLHAGASSQTTRSPWNPAARVIKWNLLRAWQANDERFLESLKHVEGNVITTMPSVAQLLCSRLSNSGVRVKPLLVLLSGETVEPDVVAQVSRVFNCPVTSIYTTTEAGVIGKVCGLSESYHVERRSVFLEILDEEARAVGAGVEGEIVVTALENYAMPLIRYRTGDRGRWREDACTCCDPAPRFQLTTSRRPTRLISTSGAAVNVVRFAKLFASFDLQRYSVHQEGDGAVVVSYIASRQLDGASASVLKTAVRAAIGPEVRVSLQRVARLTELDKGQDSREKSSAPRPGWASFEPDGPGLADLTRWLRDRLGREEGIECAVLTGSALDPDAATRYSDIDLVLFLHDDVSDPRWSSLAHQLRLRASKLSVNVDRLANLSRRAPLFVCRLLSEQLLVLGSLDDDALERPSRDDLRREGRLWAQQAAAVLWHQLTSPEAKASDPVREAWIAAKYGLNALRYRYLMCGEVETAPLKVIARALLDKERLPWLGDLVEAWEVAREHRWPPLPTPENIKSYYAAAWFCVYSTRTEFFD